MKVKKKILCSIFLLFFVYRNNVLAKQIKTSKFNEITITKPTIWKISNKKYNINGTALIGGVLFVVKAFVENPVDIKSKRLAKEIAIYALKNDYFMMGKIIGKNIYKRNVLDIIGVALITKNEYLINKTMGTRYQFKFKKLLKDINVELLPKNFNEKEKALFIKKYIDYFNNNNFTKIYDFYSINAKKQVSYNYFLNGIKQRKEHIKKILKGQYMFYVFLGKRMNTKGYNVFYKINCITVKNKKIEAYLRVMFVEEPSGFGAYGFKYFY